MEPSAPELGFRVTLPATLAPVSDAALPTIDVSRLPGARLVTRIGWSDDATPVAARTEVFVLCAEAPSAHFAPGLEEMAFSYASSFARRHLEPTGLTVWHGSAPTSGDARFTQRVSAEGSRRAELVHVLAFVGDARDVALCTLACVEPKDARACDGVLATAEPMGAFVAAPPPSPIASAVLFAAEHTHASLAAVALVAAAITLGLVVKRPRPLP